MKVKNRVFVIGLDGATLDLITGWVSEGRLPGFSRLMKDGVWGRLESVPNQRSAAAWTSLMTGKNPGKHGIYEFYEYVPGTYDIRFLNGGDRDGSTVWGLLSDQGKRVVVINVPMTYPAEEVNGVLISGLDAPGPESGGFLHPPSLKGELTERFGEYIIEPGITGSIVGNRIDEAVEKLSSELKQKSDITKYLMDSRQWDFFMVVFRSLDAAQHCFWKFMDPGHPAYTEEGNRNYGDVIYRVYSMVDDVLTELMERFGDEVTLMVVSDHGFGRKHGATQALNDWLLSKGYLHYRDDDASSTLGAFGSIGTRALAGLYKNVVGRTSRRLKERLVKFFPGIRDKVQSRLIFSGIDWHRTVAYSDTLFPNIRINLKGREPLGIVDDGEYSDVLERIKADLLEIRDSVTGERIVDSVFFRDEIYHGPHTHKAPDILIRFREDIPINSIRIEGGEKNLARSYPLIPGEDPRVISGDHRLNGIIFMKGKDIKKGRPMDGANIMDFAPTVLYLMDSPIPDDMDGKVLTEAFNESHIKESPPRFTKQSGQSSDGPKTHTASSKEESEAVAARLRDLGYLE